VIDACSWDAPGRDRYTGSVPAAIIAFGLPLATQSKLIAAFEAREFVDAVVIDRDAIRGRTFDYAPEISAMHFGSRGRICGTVTRTGWSAEHVETALVLCADGECIAWPAVCGNVFRLARRERAEKLAGPPAAVPETPGDAVAPPEPPPVLTLTSAPVPLAGPAYPPSGYGGPPDIFFGPCCATPGAPGLPPITPAIPEPSTWALLIAGGAAFLLARRRRA